MKHYSNIFNIKKYQLPDGPITELEEEHAPIDIPYEMVVVGHVPNHKRKWWDRRDRYKSTSIPDKVYFRKRDPNELHTVMYNGRAMTPKQLFSNGYHARKAREYYRLHDPDELYRIFKLLNENDKTRAMKKGMLDDQYLAKYMGDVTREGIEKYGTPIAGAAVGAAAGGYLLLAAIVAAPQIFESTLAFMASPIGQSIFKGLELEFGYEAAKNIVTTNNPIDTVQHAIEGEWGDVISQSTGAALDAMMIASGMKAAGEVYLGVKAGIKEGVKAIDEIAMETVKPYRDYRIAKEISKDVAETELALDADKAVMETVPKEGSIVSLYRAEPVNPKFDVHNSANGAAGEEYAGMWFTDNVDKPGLYANKAVRGKNSAEQVAVQKVELPKYYADELKASNIVPKDFEYEPEDFIIPFGIPRLQTIIDASNMRGGLNSFKETKKAIEALNESPRINSGRIK